MFAVVAQVGMVWVLGVPGTRSLEPGSPAVVDKTLGVR